jgi:hypothetical protein
MGRGTSILIGVVTVVLAIALTVRGLRLPTATGSAVPKEDAGARAPEAGAASESPPLTIPGATRTDDGRSEPVWDGGVAFGDGIPVPPLPLSAPREVRFGVVLVSYAGAQVDANGAPLATRSHADAKILANRLAASAARDFHAAVQQGDSGSSDDVGRVKQGILEPAAEYVLFSLAVEGVGGPVDTPRGYWIVKRLE